MANRIPKRLFNKHTLCALVVAAGAMLSHTSPAAPTGLEWVYGTPPAPELKLPLHGDEQPAFDLKSLQGKVVLINFWGTWCPPCREEMPSIQRLKDKFKQQPFEVVAVHLGPGKEDIARFVQEMEPPLDAVIVIDEDAVTSKDWQIRGLPLTWIVDHTGAVHYKATGDREWDNAHITERIAKMIEAIPQ